MEEQSVSDIKLFFQCPEIKFDDIQWEDSWQIMTWCAMSYPEHPKGCPNSKKCRFYRNDLRRVLSPQKLRIAWVEFDLDRYVKMMKRNHPDWTPKQLKNLLYWQTHLRRELTKWVVSYFGSNINIYEGAEGGGVNFYKTMKHLGVELDYPKNLHTVRVIYIIGQSSGLEDFI